MTTQTAKQSKSTATKINAIRAAAGNPMTECCTCGNSAANPYRRYVDGKIVEGCIDAFHDGHLQSTSNTEAWHNRPAARDLRRATLAGLEYVEKTFRK